MEFPARTLLLAGVLAFSSCVGPAVDRVRETKRVAETLDALHKAASQAKEAEYFALYDPEAVFLGTDAAAGASRVMVEVQQMDRFIDEQGDQLKENSHPGIKLMSRHDIVRILSTDITADCLTPGDFDGDWTVDLIDFVHFVAGVTGPGGSASPGCDIADADQDGDVDFADFAAMQLSYTGP